MKTTEERLNEVVKEMIMEHEGGTVFFDNLDKNVQVKSFTDALWNLASEELSKYGSFNVGIITSGKFGRYFHNFYSTSDQTGGILVVNGGLRSGEPIDDIFQCLDIKEKEFIFFDDSFYSGKTRDVIRDEINKHGGKLIKTFVIYDGSKQKEEGVHSLYRYYDNIEQGRDINGK